MQEFFGFLATYECKDVHRKFLAKMNTMKQQAGASGIPTFFLIPYQDRWKWFMQE